MTTSTNNRIDALIGRVKRHGAMEAFAFIPGYPAHKTPNPVTKYTVAVTDQESRIGRYFLGERIGKGKRGRLYEVTLCLRVYAPENSSGAALLRASAMLADALEAQDHDRELRSVTLSGIGYDTAARTEYRDVTAKWQMAVEEDI